MDGIEPSFPGVDSEESGCSNFLVKGRRLTIRPHRIILTVWLTSKYINPLNKQMDNQNALNETNGVIVDHYHIRRNKSQEENEKNIF